MCHTQKDTFIRPSLKYFLIVHIFCVSLFLIQDDIIHKQYKMDKSNFVRFKVLKCGEYNFEVWYHFVDQSNIHNYFSQPPDFRAGEWCGE